MHKIFSKVDTNLLLHVVYELQDLKSQSDTRIDLSDYDEFLQVSTLKL